MMGEKGVACCQGYHDGLALRVPPPLDPSTKLRVSGPSQGGIPDRRRGWG